jgi:hypothetical protein
MECNSQARLGRGGTMQDSDATPLWTDTMIDEAISSVAYATIPDMRNKALTPFSAEQLLKRMRYEYQAARAQDATACAKAVAALEAELADTLTRLVDIQEWYDGVAEDKYLSRRNELDSIKERNA